MASIQAQSFKKTIKPRRSSLSILVNNFISSFTITSTAPPSPTSSVSSEKSGGSYISAMETEYVSFPQFDEDECSSTGAQKQKADLEMEPYLEIAMVC